MGLTQGSCLNLFEASTSVLTLRVLITKPFPLKIKFEENRSARVCDFSSTLLRPKSQTPTSLTYKILTSHDYKGREYFSIRYIPTSYELVIM